MKRIISILAGLLLSAAAWGQAYPAKPIRLVVPFTAGGPMDTLARALGQRLSVQLNQPVIVDNKPGANTIIGADAVSKSAPDGYTLLMATDATVSINPLLYAKLPYNPQSDLTPVSVVAHLPEYLMVGAAVPATSLNEFIAHAKKNPGKVTFGSVGLGSSAHLAAEAFMAATGVKMVHVPYKGMSEVIPAIVSGQVDAVFTSPNQAIGFIKEGKMRALGTYGPKRTAAFPDVPTFAEAGIKGFETDVWFGILAPAKTPPQIVQMLSEQIGRVVSEPEFREKQIVANTMESAPAGVAYFSDVLKADREKYARFVKAANVKLDQ